MLPYRLWNTIYINLHLCSISNSKTKSKLKIKLISYKYNPYATRTLHPLSLSFGLYNRERDAYELSLC